MKKVKVIARTIDGYDLGNEQANPYSGSSLVPMLVIGLILTLAGMIAALALA
ncbi:hypothetical protein JQ604_20855 [Bradyrhizobium jicamae]|uniref:hypothetical protein n=1 Tax=Bradyrhizobium jicamae TaxID=280332 RepID=UPI001BAB6C87|nr:hypothetical protein [Bradyrhizobium jicamae]MBR0754643.1 hypothetical protein [Bradyrhizobium jicamae]